MYSRTSPATLVAVDGREREDSKTCPLTVPVRSRLQPGSLRPAAERFFWRVNSRIQPRRMFLGWVRGALPFVRLTFTPLRRLIKIGQGNFQSFGHPH